MPSTGAAEGLSFGLVAFVGARPVSGAELLLDLTGFGDAVASAQLVILGEGLVDKQGWRGMGPVSVTRTASENGTIVIAVTWRNELTESGQQEVACRRFTP